MSTLHQLPSSSVRLIGSTQVVTSVFSAVKELVENSIDAKASCIDVKLENFGLDKIDVRDNGCGILSSDVAYVGLRHYTSKISGHADLEALESYGFRGEAIGSLCSVADVALTTKTIKDEVSMTYDLSPQGQITAKKPSHLGQGTTVCACNLFKNLPVRKQYYNTAKKKREELKRIEDLVMSFGLIQPDIRITLRHDRDLMWQKNPAQGMSAVFFAIVGGSTMSQMEYVKEDIADTEGVLEAILPISGSNIQMTSRATNDRGFYFVNKRPVEDKQVDKLVRYHYARCHGCETLRYPVYVIAVTLPPGDLDVNVNPNKTEVMLHYKEVLLDCVRELLVKLYKVKEKTPDNDIQECSSETSTTASRDEDIPSIQTESSNSSSSVDLTNLDVVITATKSNAKLMPNVSQKENQLLNNLKITADLRNAIDIDLNSDHSSQSERLDVRTTDMDEHETEVSPKLSDSGLETSQQPSTSKAISYKDSDEFSILEDDILDDMLSDFPIEEEKQISVDINSDKQVRDSRLSLDESKDLFSADSPGKYENNNHKVVDDGRSSTTLNEDEDEPEGTSIQQAWSKGCAVKTSDGCPIEPVVLLPPPANHTPGKRPLSPTHDALVQSDMAPPAKRQPLDENQMTLLDMVITSPPTKRPLSPFTMFSQQLKETIRKEKPDVNMLDVDREIKLSWDEMKKEDMEELDEAMKKVNDRNPIHVQPKKAISKFVKSSKLKNVSCIRDRLINSSKMVKKKKAFYERKTKEVPFCLKDLKNKYISGFLQSQSQMDPKPHLIGYLKSCGVWACLRGGDISLLNTHRVEEWVLHQRLMNSHVLTADKLESPVTLSESSINLGGPKLWETLMSLDTEYLNEHITDVRLTGNGFEITRSTDGSTGTEWVEINGMATCIPTYRLDDLREILRMITESCYASLAECRPLKVVNYLKSEAVRMARQSSVHLQVDDVQALLDQISSPSLSKNQNCLHGKPFFHHLYTLSDLPATQACVLPTQA